MDTTLLIVLAAAGAVVLFFILIYNSLVRYRNHVNDSWSGVQTELQRRYDLVPNLVNAVKGYMTHERSLLEEVTRLREAAAANHGSPASQANTENAMQRALDRLMVRFEAYPELKASRNVLELQIELANTEDRIQAARRFYNGNVRELNNRVQMFPSNLIAAMFSFKTEEYFEIEDPAARNAPQARL